MDNSRYLLIEKSVKIISLVSIASFISGFLIWNVYLANFSLSEFSIIQTRFILSGAVFIFMLFVLVWFLLIITKTIRRVYNKFHETSRNISSDIPKSILSGVLTNRYFSVVPVVVFVYFVLLCFYANHLFMHIPSKFGGGEPQIRSIISTEQEINYLEPFIPKASSIQTGQFCLAYESDDRIIILLTNRIVELGQSEIKGFVTIPSKELDKNMPICSDLAYSWINNKPEK